MWNFPDSVGVKKIIGMNIKTQRDVKTRSKNYIKKQQKKLSLYKENLMTL